MPTLNTEEYKRLSDKIIRESRDFASTISKMERAEANKGSESKPVKNE